MANISIEHYSIAKSEIESYERQVNDFLERNKNKLFTNSDEIKSNIDEGIKLIGKIEILMSCLKENSDREGKWGNYKGKISNIVTGLRNIYPDIF